MPAAGGMWLCRGGVGREAAEQDGISVAFWF